MAFDFLPASRYVSLHERRNGKGLVVDENAMIQKLFSVVLRRCGYEVPICADPTEALDLARKEVPSLIMIEFNFPLAPGDVGGVMRSGFSTLASMRQVDELKDVPVVMMAGEDEVTARPRALAAGAAAYLEQFITVEALTRTVAEVLNHKLPA